LSEAKQIIRELEELGEKALDLDEGIFRSFLES